MLLLCSPVVALGALAVWRFAPASPNRVLDVRQVQVLIRHNPRVWGGRTVLVRGDLGVGACALVRCRGAQYFLLPRGMARHLMGGPLALVRRQFVAARPLLLLPSPTIPMQS